MLKLGILDLCKRGRHGSAGDALRGTLALAMEADRLGYHRYWVAEHHVEDSAEACPEVLIPLIAGCTERIKLGTAVLVLPYRNPLVTAKMPASLDVYSDGRLVLGVGAGWLAEEFDALRAPAFKLRGKIVEEWIAIFRARRMQPVSKKSM